MQGFLSGDRIGLTDGSTNRYLTTNRSTLVPGFHSLTNLSQSVDFRSQPTKGLHGRLEEILVFIIHKDGRSYYKRLTVRSLYKYVMTSITQSKYHVQQMMMEQQQQHHHQETRRQRGGSMSDEPPVPPLIDQLALSRAILNAPPVGIPERATNEAFIGPGSGSGIGSGGRAWGASERGRPSTNTNINNAVSNVTYRERLGAYLNFRDIRKIVTPFSASNEPEIIVRRHVCLINFDPLRAIILRDRCCVIVPDGADSILVELEKRIHGTDMYGSDEGDGDRVDDKDTSNKNKQGTTSSSSSKTRDDITQRDTDESFGGENISNDENHNSGNGSAAGTGTGVDDGDGNDEEDDPFAVLFDEWDELEKEDWIELPFELKCVDAVLSSSSDILGEDVLDLQMAANNMIIEMLEPRSDVGDRAQELLRVMKNSTRELISRVAGFNRAIDTTLEDSEDMALMNLGRLITHPARFIQPVPQAVLDEESDEPELILEAHLQRGHTLANALNLVDYQVKGIEDFAERKMDNIRNHILYINMMLTTLALAVAFGSFIGSLFGMNTLNGFEETTKAFLPIVFSTIVIMICFVVGVYMLVRHLGALPRLL